MLQYAPCHASSLSPMRPAGEGDGGGERPWRQRGSGGRQRRQPGRQRQIPEQQVRGWGLAEPLPGMGCSWAALPACQRQAPEQQAGQRAVYCSCCIGLLPTSRYSRLCLPTTCPSPMQPADGPAAAGRHLPPPLPAAVPHPHAGKACPHHMPLCSCSGTFNHSDMCLPARLAAEQLAASRPAAPANAPFGSWCGRKGPSLPPLQPPPAVVRAAAAEGQDWAAVQAARRSAGAQLWPMVHMQGTRMLCA